MGSGPNPSNFHGSDVATTQEKVDLLQMSVEERCRQALKGPFKDALLKCPEDGIETDDKEAIKRAATALHQILKEYPGFTESILEYVAKMLEKERRILLMDILQRKIIVLQFSEQADEDLARLKRVQEEGRLARGATALRTKYGAVLKPRGGDFLNQPQGSA